MLKVLFMNCLILIHFKLLEGYEGIYQSSYSRVEDVVNSKLINRLSDLIKFYPHYDVNFHFNTNNSYLCQKVITGLNFSIVSGIITYNYSYKKKRFTRVRSRKILHLVVLDNPVEFVFFTKHASNIKSKDVVYFLVENYETINDLIDITGLNHLGNILFIDFNKKKISIKTYRVCYYCGDLSRKVIEINISSSQTNVTNLVARNFTNFNGEVFTIIFINYYPVAWCDQTGKEVFIDNRRYKQCIKTTGSEYRLVKLVSQKLNFKTFLILYEDEYINAVNETGSGTFNVAMGGITMTQKRSELATFTTMYWYEGYSLLFFHKKLLWGELLGFLQPLQKILWISVVTVCLLNTLMFGLIDHKEKYENSKVSLLKTFWICMQVLVDQQAPYKTIKKIRNRSLILLIAWYIVCLNINTAYKSKVLSSLLNPTLKEPQTFNDLLEKSYAIVTNQNYNDVVDGLFRHVRGDKKYRDILKHPVLKDSVCKEFDYVANNLAAMIDESTSLQYEIRTTCNVEMAKYKNKLSKVRITRPDKMFGHGWVLPKGAPYADAFNKVINQIVRTGLLFKWRQDATRNMDCNHSAFSYSYKKAYKEPGDGHVTLETLVSPFFVYAVGNLCAVVVFVVECVYYKNINSCAVSKM